jgi:hypothetical protein
MGACGWPEGTVLVSEPARKKGQMITDYSRIYDFIIYKRNLAADTLSMGAGGLARKYSCCFGTCKTMDK